MDAKPVPTGGELGKQQEIDTNFKLSKKVMILFIFLLLIRQVT